MVQKFRELIVVEVKRRISERTKDGSLYRSLNYTTDPLHVAIQILTDEVDIKEYIIAYAAGVTSDLSKHPNWSPDIQLGYNILLAKKCLDAALNHYDDVTVKERWVSIYTETFKDIKPPEDLKDTCLDKELEE
jgi:hypothetical protein